MLAIFIVTLVLCSAAGGLLLPEKLVIPVQGAGTSDWNRKTFWRRPWGKSGVHRGIDIFAPRGRGVVAAASGLVLFAGTLRDGGNVVAILGPKWRIHYYAHLATQQVRGWQWINRGETIGSVGTSGNAAGKPPHLHYAIITQLPHFWRYRPERFGIDRMFYLDPGKLLAGG
jgi:murein DD-endopeptidase MepM/ murein hydrolase activator NlpD